MNQQDLMELRIRAEAGEALALFHLGRCYYEGEGVEQDFTLVHYWFEQAAKAGDRQACFYLGELYRLGNGVEVEVDVEKAQFWLNQSATQEHVDATGRL